MAKSTSWYCTPEAEDVVRARGGPPGRGRDGAVSAVVNRSLGRYAEICRRELPTLSQDEWGLVCEALMGTIHEPAGMCSMVWHGVADAVRLDGLDAKWQVDGPALIRRLKRLSFAAEVALIDRAEQYLAALSRDERPELPGE